MRYLLARFNRKPQDYIGRRILEGIPPIQAAYEYGTITKKQYLEAIR